MKKYVRVNLVDAEPMTRGEYNRFRGWTNPANENPNDEGYVIWYRKGKEDEYVSWCPKQQFDEVSREVEGLSFGMAIEAMKQGCKVVRNGWNGKGMYIWIMPGSTIKNCKSITDPRLKEIDTAEGEIRFLDSIRMRTATGDVLTGWLASQADMLSDDWMIV